MNTFQNSLNDIRGLLNDAMKIDAAGNGTPEAKLDSYQKYIKCVKEIFTVLDDNFSSCSSSDKVDNLKYVRENHLSILKSAKNCVDRLLMIIPEEIVRKSSFQSLREKDLEHKSTSMSSLPNPCNIDVLLAEKPLNPIVSAKINIKKLVDSTNMLLKSQRLTNAEKASIQLRISRQIEESLSIAKRREDQLCKVLTDNLELLNQKIEDDVNRYKFLKSHEDFQLLYRASQLFYHHILKNSRTYSFVQSRHEPESSCLSFILKMNNIHPVVKYINQCVEKLMSIQIHKDNQSVLFDEIDIFKDKMENLSKLCCLIINTSGNNTIRIVSPRLLIILFDFIFENDKLGKFIYHFLFEIYAENLKQYNTNVKFIEDELNHQILLPEKFKTQTEIIDILNQQTDDFKSLRNVFNPLKKIDVLSKIITDLMSKIQNQNSALEIGADELVPILVYMIIRLNSSELFLHGKYLEHLMPVSYLIGIEGYMLVSIICAITFCVSAEFINSISNS